MKFLPFIVLMVLSGACSDKDASPNDREPPVITITSPLNGAAFTGSQTIQILASLQDNERIAEVHLHISNSQSGALLVDRHISPASASYLLDQSFAAISGTGYKIMVIAKDNSANEGSAFVQITVN